MVITRILVVQYWKVTYQVTTNTQHFSPPLLLMFSVY